MRERIDGASFAQAIIHAAASINLQKQVVTINVELFGRETPVEISFAEIKKM